MVATRTTSVHGGNLCYNAFELVHVFLKNHLSDELRQDLVEKLQSARRNPKVDQLLRGLAGRASK